MDTLRNCISGQVTIDNTSLNNIISQFEVVKVKKGEFLQRAGSICRKMAFIENGYLRMFNLVDGKDITLWIGGKGRFITSLSSFVFETSSFWNIQAVTDCTLYIISKETHLRLCESEPKWLEFDNILLANAFALLEQNMFSQLHTTAKQRLEKLIEEDPDLFQYVPLQYIASMIGVAPESLSRLRRELSIS